VIRLLTSIAPRRLVALLALSPLLGAAPGYSAELHVDGLATARGLWAEGQPPWIEGGFGRLTEGGEAPGDATYAFRGQLQVGLDWKPWELWTLHAHGVARYEPSEAGGQRGGLVEAFLQFRPELSTTTALRLRAGTFFPPTSRENTGRLWQSPYTVTLSALNTWLGEEMRLTGLDTTVLVKSTRGDELQLAATGFVANDTLGALVAWRGWTFGDRLTSVGEVLPLPPLRSFAPGGAFAEQREGTQPFDELDGRLGWQARARWSRPEVALVQAAWTDNGGDRRLHRGQYAWNTRFWQAGFELQFGKAVTVVAEGAIGDTGMGPATPGGPRVDARFAVGYALASWHAGRWRLTARYDRFRNDDRDGTAEPDQESGEAWTAAAFWSPVPKLRLGAELVSVRADRAAAAFSGGSADTDARRALLEIRFSP